MGVKLKEFDTRYFTFYVEFEDGETRWRQEPFIHDLMFELRNLGIKLRMLGLHNIAGFERDILTKGEAKWDGPKKTKWVLKIESDPKPDNWL